MSAESRPRRQSSATPAAARRASELTILLADTDPVAVEHEQKTYTVTAIFRMGRPNGGGTGTLLKLTDVLLLAGCGKKAVADKGACKYMEEVVFRTAPEVVPQTRYVLIKGHSLAPAHYVFIDGAIAIIFLKLDTAKAVVLTRSLIESVDLAADAMEEADPAQNGDAVTPASRRVAAWLSGLLSWRAALRQLLGVLTSEQRAFIHTWVLGVKSAVSTSAGELKQRIESATSTAGQKLAAQRLLTERAAAGWNLLRETVALSAVAKKEAAAAAVLEERVAQSYAEAEQRELVNLRRMALAARPRQYRPTITQVYTYRGGELFKSCPRAAPGDVRPPNVIVAPCQNPRRRRSGRVPQIPRFIQDYCPVVAPLLKPV